MFEKEAEEYVRATCDDSPNSFREQELAQAYLAGLKAKEKENTILKGQMSLHEGILWNDLHRLEKENKELKDLIKELNEGLDKLYLSGLSDKQIAFIEQLQDKAEQFIEEVK